MSSRTRAVEVHLVPERVTPSIERAFLRDLLNSVKAERPRFVLDCSRVWEMDTEMIHLLLSCLEEVMKCNGDVRLASLRPGAESALRFAGIVRLFEIYSSTEAAAQSFQSRPTSMPIHVPKTALYMNDSENAA